MGKRKLAEASSSFMSVYDDQVLLVDNLYFSALIDDETIFPISDEKYAEELQLQEVLMSSSASSSSSSNNIHSNNISSSSSSSTILLMKTADESSPSQSFCAICMDAKPTAEMFKSNCSSHSFCTHCMSKYIGVKMQEHSITLKCPDSNCQVVLEPQMCRSIVPQQVFDRWEDALCESLILASQKFYCPFNDCSAMMVDYEGGVRVITSSECPSCRRLFCAKCGVPWHAGVECAEFEREEREKEKDRVVVELAKANQWRRCPNCRFYVDKIDGCLHISCRLVSFI